MIEKALGWHQRESASAWHHLGTLDGQQGWPSESGSRLPQSMSIPSHSPSAAAISSKGKLAMVFTQAGVASRLKAAALHHFHCEASGTSP